MPNVDSLRILLVNQSYVPDRGGSGQLLGDLVAGLREKGAHITVVAAPPTYTDEELAWERQEQQVGLEVFRVGPERFKGRKFVLNRVAGYVGFLWAAFRTVGRLVRERQFDVITTASNPPLVGVIGAWYGAWTGIPFVYMLHDLHPDSLLGMRDFSLPRPAVRAWDRLNSYVFRRARQIVVMGPRMKERLVAKAVAPDKVRVIHQWAHPEFSPAGPADGARASLGIGLNDLVVLYFGNMGPAHNLDWLVKAVDALRDLPLSVVFIGDGMKRVELQQEAGRLGLTQVRFLPYQTGEAFREMAAVADVGVATLKRGLEGLGVPSKAYSILALGRPILAIMAHDADIARLVEDHDCGWVAETPEEVVAALTEAAADRERVVSYGRNARAVYDRHFSLARAADEYWETFRLAASERDEGVKSR